MAVIGKILFWTVVVVAPGGLLLLPFLMMKRRKVPVITPNTAPRQA